MGRVTKASLSCSSSADILLEDNTSPKSYYQAKNILSLMGMEYQKIHACPNDCILYRHEFQEMHKFPKCGISWYKVKDESTKKDPLVKVLWYLPIIPRFKRLFANVDDAKDLSWHAYGRNHDGMFRHLANSYSGRRLVICIQILRKRQEILGLDLSLIK